MRIPSKGFTLIELLMVVSIISLLSSVVFSTVTSARVKARDARRFQDLAQIRSALNLYFDTNNSYPLTSPACTPWNRSDASTLGAPAGYRATCWSGELGTALLPWLPVLPVDPRNLTTPTDPPVAYIYIYQSMKDGAGYRLGTVLETNSALGSGCVIAGTGPTGPGSAVYPASFYCLGENWQ